MSKIYRGDVKKISASKFGQANIDGEIHRNTSIKKKVMELVKGGKRKDTIQKKLKKMGLRGAQEGQRKRIISTLFPNKEKKAKINVQKELDTSYEDERAKRTNVRVAQAQTRIRKGFATKPGNPLGGEKGTAEKRFGISAGKSNFAQNKMGGDKIDNKPGFAQNNIGSNNINKPGIDSGGGSKPLGF